MTFPKKPWTIVKTGWYPEEVVAWYAKNIQTGETKPYRKTYDEALKDIPGQGPHSEPWGV